MLQAQAYPQPQAAVYLGAAQPYTPKATPPPSAAVHDPPFGMRGLTLYAILEWFVPEPLPDFLLRGTRLVPIPPLVHDPPFGSRFAAILATILEAWRAEDPPPALPRPLRQPGPQPPFNPNWAARQDVIGGSDDVSP